MRVVVACALMLSVAACSGGSDAPSDEITRIDGPAVVDEDVVAPTRADDPSDG